MCVQAAIVIAAAAIALCGVPMADCGVCSSNIIYLHANNTAIQELTSPNYPENYPDNELCRWVIAAPESFQVIQIRIVDADIPNSVSCQNDYLQIQDGNGLYAFALRTCCGNAGSNSCLGDEVVSSQQKVRVSFRSDNSLNDKGFKLEYWAVNKLSTEVKRPDLGPVNYVLFTLFGLIVSSIVTALFVVRMKGRNKGTDKPQMNCDSQTIKPLAFLIFCVVFCVVGLPIFIVVIYQLG